MFGCKRRRSTRPELTSKTNKTERITSKPSSSAGAAAVTSTLTKRLSSGAAGVIYSFFKGNPFSSNNAKNAITNLFNERTSSAKQKSHTVIPLIPGISIENGAVILWSFPRHISQTRLGDRKELSNACCLISCALAELIYRNGIYLPMWDGTNCIDIDALYFSTKQRSKGLPIQTPRNLLPSRLCEAMVNAIVNGNTRADFAYQNGKENSLFNIPTALQLLDSNFGEIAYVTTKSEHGDSASLLYGNLKSAIDHPSLHNWKQLFFLTMFVERCVLIVYERDTNAIGILDSHTHRIFGALIAVSDHGNLHHFCSFIIRHFFPETLALKPEKMKFELSLLYFQGVLNDLDSPIDTKCIKRAKIFKDKEQRPNVFENYEKCLKEVFWKNTHTLHIKKKGLMGLW